MSPAVQDDNVRLKEYEWCPWASELAARLRFKVISGFEKGSVGVVAPTGIAGRHACTPRFDSWPIGFRSFITLARLILHLGMDENFACLARNADTCVKIFSK
jgi:hypothetical protein